MAELTVFRQILDGFCRLLAPPLCPGCDLSLPQGQSGFCSGCASLIERTPPALSPPARTSAPYFYGGPLADAIRRFKYDGRTEYAAALGELLCRVSLPYAGRIDLIVPMPLHPSRLRQRGFNQSALLARSVARFLGIGLDVKVLQRVRKTSDQTRLSRAERILNVQGAFKAYSKRALPRILLIDDIRTTGSTLASAAEALLDASAISVDTLALAYTDPSNFE